MGYECKYCGQTYCAEHRLPENHDCPGLENAEPATKGSSGEKSDGAESSDSKWFREEKVRERPPSASKRSFWRDVLRTFKDNVTLTIITVTTLVFTLQLALQGLTQMLYLQPELSTVLQRPWTLLTVMLVHGGYFHIFANMVTFYFFGSALENIIDGEEVLKFYIGAGLISSIGFVALTQLLSLVHGAQIGGLPVFRPAVGASGAVVAVFGAVAMLYPRAEVLLYFFIPMKIKTAFYGVAAIEAVNLGAKFAGIVLPVLGGFASSAHLAGLLVGALYGRRLRRKYDTRTGVLDILGS